MKILKINTYLVRPRWCMVEIVTDQGFIGWGEAVIEGKASTVAACVKEMEEYIIGKNPLQIDAEALTSAIVKRFIACLGASP